MNKGTQQRPSGEGGHALYNYELGAKGSVWDCLAGFDTDCLLHRLKDVQQSLDRAFGRLPATIFKVLRMRRRFGDLSSKIASVVGERTMNASLSGKKRSGVGTDLGMIKHGPHEFARYLADRSMPVKGMLASEATVDVRLTFSRPVKEVWRVMRDFNLWHNRYGYEWTGVIGDEENNIVYLNNRKNNNFGTKIPYVVRRIIPEKLIYQESLPHPFPDNSGFWSGHNVLSFWEEGGKARVTVFMEHTFFSQELSIEELRKIASDLMFEQGIGFWREYFIPDLETLIEKGKPVGG